MNTSVKKKYPHQDQSLKDREGEEWDDIPFLDGAYQISNYGRVKSLRRWMETPAKGGHWILEKILKTHVGTQIISNGKRKLHRLKISISFEGKKQSLGIARMVYYLFVEKFDLKDRRLVVSCKDENAFNILPGNLILTTPSKNISKAYKKNRRPRDSFGNKARPVSQYDSTGKWLCTYPSLSQAEKSTGIDCSGICESLNRGHIYICGYLWRYGSNKKKIKIPASVNKRLASEKLYSQIISQYDLQGKKIKEHPNLKVAAKAVNVQTSEIRAVILGIRLSSKKYYWIPGPGPDKISLQHIEENIKQWKEKVCRRVTQYDLRGKKIGAYSSITEASRILDLHPMDIGGALRNEYNSISGGFLWAYGNGPARIKVNPTVKRKYHLQQLYQQQVTQYNKQGIRIAQYASLKEAAEAVKCQIHGLGATLEGKYLTFKGYFWRLGIGEAKINVNKANKVLQSRLKKISKPIVQYDLDGRRLKEYESLCAASRATNTSTTQIRRVALGKYKKAKGFVWKFKE
jgi:NUMOD4 motif/NUMOD1 domain